MDINNSKNLDMLLGIVGAKLGMKPDELKSQLESGKFDSALKNMSRSDAEKFQQVLNNPKLLEQLISAPQAQALYKKLAGGK
ncbi:MAG: hypothetical protein N2Z57_02485 [Oscillospiraceae bacterium]|nr:hypothetical protein [Oscillospiraceae bacterium]